MRIDIRLSDDLVGHLLKYSQTLQRLLKRFQHLLRTRPTVAGRFDRLRQQRVEICQVCFLAFSTDKFCVWQSTRVKSQLLGLLKAEEKLFQL